MRWTYRGVPLFVGTIFLSFFGSDAALLSCVSGGADLEVEAAATGARGDDRNDLVGFDESWGLLAECSRDIKLLGVAPLSGSGDLDVLAEGSGVGSETVRIGMCPCCDNDLVGVVCLSAPSNGASSWGKAVEAASGDSSAGIEGCFAVENLYKKERLSVVNRWKNPSYVQWIDNLS